MQLFVQWKVALWHLKSILCLTEIIDKPLYSQLLLVSILNYKSSYP